MRSVTWLCVLLWPSLAFAELPSPRLDRIAPLGAANGSTVEVEIAGADLEEPRSLLFDHPGLTSEFVKDRTFRVRVANDVPPGTYDVRVVSKYGVSSPRLFAVSRGFEEVMEKEPNNDAATAQKVPINSVVNGNSDNSGEDVFRFTAKKGQRIVLECRGQALDSMIDATLMLTDSDGRPLASSGDYNGRDPLIDFVAAKDGDYIVSLFDLSYRGGLPYRLVISDKPQVENVFPRAVQAGKSTAVTVLGRNLGSSSKPSKWKLNDLPLDETNVTATPPDVLARREYRFVTHPTTHSVLPTAATSTLTGFQFQPTIAGIIAEPVPLLVCDTPVTLEAEPNDDPAKPQMLTLPAVVSGRFDRERDADWYEFESAEAGSYSFEVYCERIAGRADPYLVLVDEKENRVGELDDFGIRSNAFDGHLRDPSGSFNLAAKKKYRVLVQDRYRRGGARYQYVLTIQKPESDFFAAAIHRPSTQGPSGINVYRGGANFLDVIIHNKSGYSGPITITAENLPNGLHVPPTTITNDTKGTIVLWADADAPAFVGPIRLTATGQNGEVAFTRNVRPYSRVWQAQDQNSSRPTREQVVAIVPETSPFSMRFADDKISTVAGKKLEVKLICDRLRDDFKAAITVTGLNLPNPIKVSQATAPEGKSEVTITFDVAANARPGEYTVVLQGQAQVTNLIQAKSGKASSLATLPSRPITIVVAPPTK